MTYKDPRLQNTNRAYEMVRDRLREVFALFDDPHVTEININGGENIWIAKNGIREKVEGLTVPEIVLTSALRELASSMGQDAIPETPSAMVHAKMPGLRFSGCLAPTASGGTIVSIRKHSPRVLSLEDYVKWGTLPQHVADFLRSEVARGANMLVAGGTDSGKTTFLNALSREIPLTERVATIEDTRELMLVVGNWFAFEYNKQAGITATMCVDMCMRSSPDRILLGEMKDEVAAAFLEAANTGHHGMAATTHANSSLRGLDRVELLTLRAGLGWPLEAIRQTVGSTIDIVVHLRKRDGRRELAEVARVKGYDVATSSYRLDYIWNIDNPELVSGAVA